MREDARRFAMWRGVRRSVPERLVCRRAPEKVHEWGAAPAASSRLRSHDDTVLRTGQVSSQCLFSALAAAARVRLVRTQRRSVGASAYRRATPVFDGGGVASGAAAAAAPLPTLPSPAGPHPEGPPDTGLAGTRRGAGPRLAPRVASCRRGMGSAPVARSPQSAPSPISRRPAPRAGTRIPATPRPWPPCAT